MPDLLPGELGENTNRCPREGTIHWTYILPPLLSKGKHTGASRIKELVRELLPMIGTEVVQECLRILNELKFPGSDKLHPGVKSIKETCSWGSKPLSIIFVNSRTTREVSEDRGRTNGTYFFRKKTEEENIYRSVWHQYHTKKFYNR